MNALTRNRQQNALLRYQPPTPAGAGSPAALQRNVIPRPSWRNVLDYFKGNIFGRPPEGKWFGRQPGSVQPGLYAEPVYNWELGEIDPPGKLPVKRLGRYKFTAEDFELKPEKTKHLLRIALRDNQTGNIKAYKYGQEGVYNHSDIAIKHDMWDDVTTGFIDKRGKFTEGWEEPSKIKSQTTKDHLHTATKNYFGTTEDPKEAGYILDNGEMLDFSGKNQGGSPGMRAFDHREIHFVDDPEYGQVDEISGWFDEDSPTADMRKFMDETGAIRLSVQSDNSANIDIKSYPTDEQWEQIKRIAQRSNEIFVDITGDRSETIGGHVYWNTIDAKQFGPRSFDEIKQFVNQTMGKK